MDDRSPLETQSFVLPFLSGCSSIAPAFVSLGNHEQMLDSSDLETIRNTGVTLLDNEFTSITVNGQKIGIGGLTSGYVTDYRRSVAALTASERGSDRYPKKESIQGMKGLKTASERLPDTSWMQAFSTAPADYRIILNHHPEYISYVPEGIDLILSGHAHGGQWRYYSLIHREWKGVFAPGQGWFPKLTSGVIDGRLVISRGLANTARIPRINNKPELIFIH